MKIKHLIEQLQKLNPDLTILLASDAEGNNYQELWKFTQERYIERSKNELELVHPDEVTDEELMEIDECIVFWP